MPVCPPPREAHGSGSPRQGPERDVLPSTSRLRPPSPATRSPAGTATVPAERPDSTVRGAEPPPPRPPRPVPGFSFQTRRPEFRCRWRRGTPSHPPCFPSDGDLSPLPLRGTGEFRVAFSRARHPGKHPPVEGFKDQGGLRFPPGPWHPQPPHSAVPPPRCWELLGAPGSAPPGRGPVRPVGRIGSGQETSERSGGGVAGDIYSMSKRQREKGRSCLCSTLSFFFFGGDIDNIHEPFRISALSFWFPRLTFARLSRGTHAGATHPACELLRCPLRRGSAPARWPCPS